MGKYVFSITIILLVSIYTVIGQGRTISGKIINANDSNPVSYAVIAIPGSELWTTANEKGEFMIKNVPEGKTNIVVQSLGYVKTTVEIIVQKTENHYIIPLPEINLKLPDVTVVAKRSDDIATSYIISSTTLAHMQALAVTDIMSLLPGGQTRSNHTMMQPSYFALRSNETTGMGNPSFGTGIEIDGVRISGNGLLDESATTSSSFKGVDTRSVGSSNIESIEVVTGLPSVEYGDISNGVVKINTRKGKSRYIIDIVTKPNSKQYAIGKGYQLSPKAGALNINIEHTKSISQPASPYTSYARNNLSLLYSNSLNQERNRPIKLTVGVTGNLGGYNTKSDPDSFKDTYTKEKDNTLRGHFTFNWLINKPWITNIEASGSFNYSDRLTETKSNGSSSSSTTSIRTDEEGYHITTNYDDEPNAPAVIIPPGYWYNTRYNDNKAITYNARIKANWSRKFGNIRNNIMLGSDFNSSGNLGRGTYYKDMRHAPSWREYRYDKIPFLNTLAVYAEDRVIIPVRNGQFNITAGVRSEITFVNQSEYGNVSSMSPRINAKYTFFGNKNHLFNNLTIRAGWGDAVKLPSLQILYPQTTYTDIMNFSSTSFDGTAFTSYYTMPGKATYNSNLKWQSSRQKEIGVEFNLGTTQVSLVAFHNKTINPYIYTNEYSQFSYNLTTPQSLNDCPIPPQDRIFDIDKNTGIVTVFDKTGTHPNQELSYITRERFKSNIMAINGSPTSRMGLEWVVDFGKIEAIKTSIRLDGNYHRYKGIEESIMIGTPSGAQNMDDGRPYRYLGYYVGGASGGVSNGKITERITSNLTLTTHIPSIRLIFSLRLEASLYHRSQNLLEYKGKSYGFVADENNPNMPSATNTNIYGGDQYVGMWPLYYVSFEDMNTLIPFAEKFIWAKDNDPTLYKELSKLVMKSNYINTFNANKISNYISANISITKEIGNFASITFNANNFNNNMGLINSSQTGHTSSLYNSGYIPQLYYGLSLKLKL